MMDTNGNLRFNRVEYHHANTHYITSYILGSRLDYGSIWNPNKAAMNLTG